MTDSPIPADATNAAWHPRCKQWWTGSRAAHCSACCRTFSSTTAFDAHQRNTEPGHACRAPEAIGLVPIAKPYGVLWSLPGGDFHPPRRDAD